MFTKSCFGIIYATGVDRASAALFSDSLGLLPNKLLLSDSELDSSLYTLIYDVLLFKFFLIDTH